MRSVCRLKSLGYSAAIFVALLMTATTVAAESLRMVGDTGAVAPGYFADIIAVEGDPLEDISVLQNVTFVMKGGIVYKTSE